MSHYKELNTFGNFIETDNMKRENVMIRDLFNYTREQIGGVFYDRNSGGFLSLMENNENSQTYDLIIKVKFIEIVAKYNLSVTPEYQVATSADMIVIDRAGNRVTVFLGFIPLVNPKLESLRSFPISFGGQ